LPHRIIGNEKCTHPNKKTGLQDCPKLGRFKDKPMISWNTKHDKPGKKRYYRQFIHNDGTRHNIANFEEYRLNEMKGNVLEELYNACIKLARTHEKLGDFFHKVAKASRQWDLSESEWNFLTDSMKHGDFEPIINKYKEHEYKRRQQIYKDSQDKNDEIFRSYGSLIFEETDTFKTDRIARKVLSLDREKRMSLLQALDKEEFMKVDQSLNEMINAYQKWLYDYKEDVIEVARQKFKGKIPPETERMML